MTNNKKTTISGSHKRKEILAQRKKKTKNILIAAIFVVILISLIIIITIFMGTNTIPNKTDQVTETPIQSQTEINIPLSDLSTTAKFYSYETEKTTIRFFAVIGSDNILHLAIDACDVCYSAKKGYRQLDDHMQCINCGNQYPITNIGTQNTAGGCWPSYIPTLIYGENIVIQITDLESKAYMF
ncbi:MAG: DUF2318 domain-containing protein [Candidatus Thermoplasmatota archaeon]|nr:DUF2318 domain-containing protein [Candidatus Thermoplasmatota archaeon]MBU1941911.1 DUF2318 domain-containing protein [Candidatus Thermoplasmatota archaeon]